MTLSLRGSRTPAAARPSVLKRRKGLREAAIRHNTTKTRSASTPAGEVHLLTTSIKKKAPLPVS